MKTAEEEAEDWKVLRPEARKHLAKVLTERDAKWRRLVEEAHDAAELAWSTLGSLQCDEVWEALKQAAQDGLKAGIARGRALGAREAIAVAREFSDRRDVSASKITNQYERSVQRDLASEAKAVADEIARRAGRGTP